MSADEEARRFLAQLREQTYAALGNPRGADPALVQTMVENILREKYTPEEARDPDVRAAFDTAAAMFVRDIDEGMAFPMVAKQERIEQVVSDWIASPELAPKRPLVSHLRTGQLNAVTLRVPGPSGAHLVLFEDQLRPFVLRLSQIVAWAYPPDTTGTGKIVLSKDVLAERIESNVELFVDFVEVVGGYALGGGFLDRRYPPLPPAQANMARLLKESLEYFVLGHEYAHIILGHLDATPTRKAVLPAADAEALNYSWLQEHAADALGVVLSIYVFGAPAHGDSLGAAMMGVNLFFDALDVMDRAIALLHTGDEDARQLGSHPPADLRKEVLRDNLPVIAERVWGDHPVRDELVEYALAVGDIQGEVTRLLWQRYRPYVLNMHRDGVRPARMWRTVPKETNSTRAAASPAPPAPKPGSHRRWPWSRR
jgi:hypothetical protein